MNLEELVLRAIEDEWENTRPPDGVGATDSSDVHARLVREGVEVPRGAMNEILEDFSTRGLIRGTGYSDREGIEIHGARAIIEP